MNFKHISLLILCLATVALIGCNGGGTQPTDTYDRAAMLQDVADSIIEPGYNLFEAHAAGLQASVIRFSVSPNASNLLSARLAWQDCFDSWQHVVSFDFGPAETIYGNVSVELGTYPASPTKIESFILANDTLLQGYDRDARGLMALDYLLFQETATKVIEKYLSQPSRKSYTIAVARKIYSESQRLLSTWRTSYTVQFVSNSGTDAGSSTSALFNQLNISFENLKNYKLALPMGRRAGQTQIEPDRVEGFYSSRSVLGLKNHFASIRAIWERGFSDYLKTVASGERVEADTREQLGRVDSILSTIHDSEVLAALIANNDSRLVQLFEETQKLTRYLKSETSSVLGIAITYSSGDGD